MIPEFQYKGFEPDDHVVAEAEGILDRIRDLAPAGSTIVSLLDYSKEGYACSIDIYLRRGSVHASTSEIDPFKTLHRAEETIIEKLNKQKETKFFTKKPEALTNKKRNTFESAEQT